MDSLRCAAHHIQSQRTLRKEIVCVRGVQTTPDMSKGQHLRAKLALPRYLKNAFN